MVSEGGTKCEAAGRAVERAGMGLVHRSYWFLLQVNFKKQLRDSGSIFRILMERCMIGVYMEYKSNWCSSNIPQGNNLL